MNKIKILVTYRGAYKDKFEDLKSLLLDKLKNIVDVAGTPAKTKIDYFEVQLDEDGPILWSKAQTGQFPEEKDVDKMAYLIKDQASRKL